MLGAITGDVVGSRFEGRPCKRTDFELFGPGSRFTDDTVLTVATADAILTGAGYGDTYQEWFHRYPGAGFGGMFIEWGLSRHPAPYGSFGNGSAMRVGPVGLAFDNLDKVLAEAERSAAVTHDHPAGITGAQAVASAVYLARGGASKVQLRQFVAERFGYDLDRTVDQIRPLYSFDVTCQGSVPQAIVAFLDSEDFEHALRLAISLGGDSDTLAAIAGSVSEAYYGGVPTHIVEQVTARLDERMLQVVADFSTRFGESSGYRRVVGTEEPPP